MPLSNDDIVGLVEQVHAVDLRLAELTGTELRRRDEVEAAAARGDVSRVQQITGGLRNIEAERAQLRVNRAGLWGALNSGRHPVSIAHGGF